MSIRKILTEPDKILRQVSKPVEGVGNEEQDLMRDMLDTMYAAKGIGLAAIQVGIPKRIIVIDGVTEERCVRITETTIQRAWARFGKKAGFPDLQIKDLRTFFNWALNSHYHLSNKEAGSYLGNSEQVNYEHYTPVDLKSMSSKLKNEDMGELLPQLMN